MPASLRALLQYNVSARHHPVGSIRDGGEDAIGLKTHSCKGSSSVLMLVGHHSVQILKIHSGADRFKNPLL
jgi:hypothetical protein